MKIQRISTLDDSLFLVTIVFLVKLLQNEDIRNKNMLIFVFIFFKSSILFFLFFNWDISSLTFKNDFNNTKDFNSSKNDKKN